MKRVLLCVILSICIFLLPNFVENAKAYSSTADSVTVLEGNINIQNLRNVSDEELKNINMNIYRARMYAKQQIQARPDLYDDYVILGKNGYLILYKNSDVYENSLQMFVNRYNESNTYFRVGFFRKDTNSFSYHYYVGENKMTYTAYQGSINEQLHYGYSIAIGVLESDRTNVKDEDIKFNLLYDSSLPIYLRKNMTERFNNSSYVAKTLNLKIQKNTLKILTYNPEQIVIDQNGNFVDPIKYEEKANYRYNELGENLSKVEVTFKEKAMTVTGKAHFKINYKIRLYDEENPNVMRLTGYKIYGTHTVDDSPIWEEITENEKEYFSDIELKQISDVEYEYTATFNTPTDMCVHEQYRIEFYFENARYYDVTIYDDLKKTGNMLEQLSYWNAYLNFLSDYRHYKINGANAYAFISSNKKDNQGRIYFVANDSTLIGTELYNYNFSTKQLGIKYFPRLYESNTIYYYTDFHFNYDNNEILLLKKDISSSTSNWIEFWVHKDYYVSTVMPDDNNFQYNTPDNGFQNGSKDDLDNFFYPSTSSDSVIKQVVDFFDNLKMNVNYFNQVFDSFFSQLPVIVQNLCVVIFILFLIFLLLKMGGWNS